MKKLLVSFFAFFVFTSSCVFAATSVDKNYTNLVMNRLDQIVAEKTSTSTQALNLWKTIQKTISQAIDKKESIGQTVHPVLYLVEESLADKLLMISMNDVVDENFHGSAPLLPTDSGQVSSLVQEMLTQLNAERAKVGASPLVINATLNTVAQKHAEYMSNNNYFNHEEKDGTDPTLRVERAGYNWSFVGENIAMGQRSVSQAMIEWMGSIQHKQNILDTDFVDVGFGYYNDYWVQLFAAPLK